MEAVGVTYAMSRSAPSSQPISPGTRIPTAGPPPAPPSRPLVEPRTFFRPLTKDDLKGWAGSLILHSLFLLTLALWYFSPHARSRVVFDSWLAGSQKGVENGELLHGGLDAPVEIPPAEFLDVSTPLDSSALSQLEVAPLEPELRPGHARRPTAPGGAPSDNPGAGDGEGFGLARFGEGGEMIRGVSVRVGDPQFTLIWNADGVDLDLHVIEPGGKEIYWEEPKGDKGGELDVDNTKGFGPENVYWLVDSEAPDGKKVKGPGPPGVYKWFVSYYGGFGGMPKPTQWQVRVKHDGKVSVHRGRFQSFNQRSRVYTLEVEGTEPPPEPAKEPKPAIEKETKPVSKKF